MVWYPRIRILLFQWFIKYFSVTQLSVEIRPSFPGHPNLLFLCHANETDKQIERHYKAENLSCNPP